MIERAALVHRLVLRGFDVELRLPRDLSHEEAARICRLVEALAVPEEPPVLSEGPR